MSVAAVNPALEVVQVVLHSRSLQNNESTHIFIQALRERVIEMPKGPGFAGNALTDDLTIIFRVQMGRSGAEAGFQVYPTLVQDSADVQIEPRFLAHVLELFGQVGREAVTLIRRRGEPIAQFGIVNAFCGLSETFRCIVRRSDQIMKSFNGALVVGHNSGYAEAKRI